MTQNTLAIEVANTLRAYITPLLESTKVLDEIKGELRDGKTADQNSRATILTAIAGASAAGKWSEPVIAEAVKLVSANKALGNSAEKLPTTILNFCSELKLAAHPKVRDQVASLFAMVDTAWEDEESAYNADKTAPTPIKAAFSRRYHAKLAIVRAVRGESTVKPVKITTPADVVNYAISRDPSFDPQKADKELDRILNQLKDIQGRFNHERLSAAIEALVDIDATDLAECATARTNPYRAGKAAPVHTPAPAKPTKVGKAEPEPAENEGGDTNDMQNMSDEELLAGLGLTE